MKVQKITLLAGAAVVLAGFSSTAHAQGAEVAAQSANDAQPQSGGLQEIVVTATRRAENLQRTPVSVTALTAVALEQGGIRDTMALQQQTPSLQITPSGGGNPNSPLVALRGQFQNAINITNDPSVALYIDDIYVGKDAGSVTDVLDVARVEVLKGPQGTLFGRNSTGGAIRYISNRPDPTAFSGSVRAGYGNYDDIKLEGVLNVPISDKAAIRYAGLYRQHDGYTKTTYVNVTGTCPGVTCTITPVRTEDTDDLKAQLHRLSILLQPTDRLSVVLVGSYHKRTIHGYLATAFGFNQTDDSPGDLFRVTPASPQSPALQNSFYAGYVQLNDGFADIDPVAYAKGYQISGTVDYELSDSASLKLITGYLNNKTLNKDFNTDGTVRPEINGNTFQHFKQFSTELQLSGQLFNDTLDYVTGLYYFREKGLDTTDSHLNVSAVPLHSFNSGVGKNRSESAFAHFQYHIGESTTIQAGGRYTIDTKKLSVTNRTGNVLATAPCGYVGGEDVDLATCLYTPNAKFKFWSYTFGVDHRFADGVFAYVKTSRTQRSGGHQVRASNGDIGPFRPETITDYEAGLKLDLFDRHVRLNGAYFYGNYKDIQFTQSISFCRSPLGGDILTCAVANRGTTTVVANVGDATIQGFEVEANARFAGFGLDLGASYVDVNYKRFSSAEPANNRQQFYVPKWQFNAALSYEADVGVGKLNARVSYFWKDDVNKEICRAPGTPAVPPAVNPPGTCTSGTSTNRRLIPVPSYGIVGARLGLTLGNGIDVAVWGQNLTKEKYYGDALNFPSPAAGNYLVGYGYQPRTYGIEVGYKF